MQQLKLSLIWKVGDFKEQYFAGEYRQNDSGFYALFLCTNLVEGGMSKD